jgi:hypothetical protein
MSTSLVKRKPSSAIDADGPIEDTDIAIQKMKDVGFDLDKDIDDLQLVPLTVGGIGNERIKWQLTPMVHFVIKGDLKMCRYLFVNGAKCTHIPDSSANTFQFPLSMAAQEGLLDICKWLYEYGAKEEIQMKNGRGNTPLRDTILTQLHFYVYTKESLKNKFSISQWLILNGALCCRQDHENDDDDSDSFAGQIDEVVLKRDLSSDSRPMFLSWAQKELDTRNNFLLFLYHVSQHKQYHIFNGNKSGIMENIADYVGIVRGRDLRILRQLANLLSTYIQEEDEESSS